MKDKQQQVEEITKVLLDCGRQFENIDTAMADYNYVSHFYPIFKTYAEALVKNNIIQIQEDDIVIPKDEYRYIKDMADRYDPFWFCAFGGCEGVCKECKDTCEMSIFVKERNKFYDKFNENICTFKLENKSQEYADGYAQAIADICGRLDETAMELGVVIKEN